MNEVLNYILFQIGDFKLKISSILLLLVFVGFIVLFLKIINKTINSVTKIDIGKRYAIYNLIKYIVYIFAFAVALQILGFNLSLLIGGSAALLVGLGLGLQSLFSDFISGIILLVDSSVKVDDVIEVKDLVCKVQEINLRTTTVMTRDDKYIILPNTDLTRNQLINWTHNHVTSRFEIAIGVDYDSDVSQVMQLLKEAVENQKGVLSDPMPFVRFTDFGDSALQFSVFFWSEEVFRVENIKSAIRKEIFESFKSNNIVIPFPQRVVHFPLSK